MRRWIVLLVWSLSLLHAPVILPAEITEVVDAADDEDPFDLNLDVGFRSILNRSKITHEWADFWRQPQWHKRPDFNELRFQEQVFAMDYMLEIGLYHDVQLYVNLPWIISDKKTIGFASGVSNRSSTLYGPNAASMGNALALDPTDSPSTTRSGIGDMSVGAKWAVFNDERDDTKSVWIIGLDYTIPSGTLAEPRQVAPNAQGEAQEGTVGLGHHVLTPSMLFSRRYSVLDPYVGIHGSVPIQGREASRAGFNLPYSGGFLAGMEIVPWENKDKHQKFAIDLRITTSFFGELDSKGDDKKRGSVNEMSDFLASDPTNADGRQLQAMSNYTQFGLHLGFVIRAAEFVRLRFGASLAHNTEHFLTGADFCKDGDGDGACTADDPPNPYYFNTYDKPGYRLRVEETTLFTWWATGMLTF